MTAELIFDFTIASAILFVLAAVYFTVMTVVVLVVFDDDTFGEALDRAIERWGIIAWASVIWVAFQWGEALFEHLS